MLYVDEWRSYLEAVEGKAPATARKYARRVLDFGEQSGLEDPGAITFDELEEYLKRLYYAGMSSSTRTTAVAALRGFCSYLCARGIIERSPARILRPPPQYRREKPTFTRDELRRLIYGREVGAMPNDPRQVRNRVLLYLVYIVGLRASEPGRLDLQDLEFDHEERVFSILIKRAKRSSEDARRTLDDDGSRLLGYYLTVRDQLPGSAGQALFPNPWGRGLTSRSVYNICVQRIRDARIAPRGRTLSPHTLRHSIATHLLQAGHNPKEVQEHMRHADFKTTAGYLHADRKKSLQRLRRMHPLRPKKSRANLPAALRALQAELVSGGGAPPPTPE